MTVQKLIDELSKMERQKQVVANDEFGNRILFAVEGDGRVFLETTSDIEMEEELRNRFEVASIEFDDELDFFMELVDVGYTLEDIEKYVPEKYEYAKQFMEEHGLA